jgi:PAS domain-containing protein
MRGATEASLEETTDWVTQLRAHESRLQSVVDALPVLVAYVDADLTYRLVNQTYERWFGAPKVAFLGKTVGRCSARKPSTACGLTSKRR